VRVARHYGVVEADLTEQFLAAAAAFDAAIVSVDHQRLDDDLLNTHAGIESGVGILKNGLHATAQGWQLALRDAGDGLAVKGDGTRGGLEETEDDAGNGAFAGAGFADEAEGFSALDGEGDTVDDGHAGFCVRLGQVASDQQRHVQKLTGSPSD
jgi:hypothetical protein